ncbi:MAG: M1 family aminopeptidase, partial [Vicinamibacterales bacterium]
LWTMTWFDDVWMKEMFANYMAAKIVNPRFPDLDHDLRFLHMYYPSAYDVDRTAGTHAIRQPLSNLNEAGSLYGAIIYLKSPIVMRQLAMLIGEQTLRDALCEFLDRYRFSNASWPDLLDLLASHTALDLHAWSRAWIDGAGRPVVRAELKVGSGLAHLDLHSDNAALTTGASDGSPRQKWPQRLEVGLGYGKWVEHISMSLDGRADVSTIVGYPPPAWVLPNGRGIGYGEFRLEEGSLAWLLEKLPDVPDALTRGSAWLTLWDAMLVKDIVPEQLLALAVRAVPLETSELNLQRILIYIERLFWIFLTPDQRETNAKWLGAILRASVGSAPTISQKAALFACLRAVATTESMVEWMRALWRGDARIDGLPLGEGDQINLTKELAVRVPDGDSLVQQQVSRTRSRDGRDALAFMAQALSTESNSRDRFFETISDPANRRREPWVVDGMRWLHHPLRADTSVKYIEPGLQLLSEVKRTSDVFLPKRWVDAMLSGHSSPRAAMSVRRFLDSRPPHYPPALRRMVLASADYLLRAAWSPAVLRAPGQPAIYRFPQS